MENSTGTRSGQPNVTEAERGMPPVRTSHKDGRQHTTEQEMTRLINLLWLMSIKSRSNKLFSTLKSIILRGDNYLFLTMKSINLRGNEWFLVRSINLRLVDLKGRVKTVDN